jgi:hypothetical protein
MRATGRGAVLRHGPDPDTPLAVDGITLMEVVRMESRETNRMYG